MQKMLLALTLTFSTSAAFAGVQFSTETTQIITSDGQNLKAVFVVPANPVAAILILQGSGNVDLDGDVSGPFLGTPYQGGSGKLSLQVAEAFAKQGIATLRFSKRGVDDASQLPNQKFPFLLSDAESAYQLMLKRFQSIKHGVLGFSEGGIVASLLANQVQVDSLFLLAPVTRDMDHLFGYQFVEWPTKTLLNHLGAAKEEAISATMISMNPGFKLPILNAPLVSVDSNQDGKISVSGELLTAYQALYFQIRGLLATPEYSGWYQSLKALAPYSEIAAKIKAPSIFVYQGMKDSQLNPLWALEDAYAFSVKPTIRLYTDLGHCFSPMDGVMGEVKTSGPHAPEMLQNLAADATQALK